MSKIDSAPIHNVFVDMPITDSDVREYEYRKVRPDGNINTAGENNTEYEINCRTAGLDGFILPQRAYIVVKYKMLQSDKATVATTGKHQILASSYHLFDQVRIGLGGETLEVIKDPGTIVHLKHLLQHSKEDVEVNGPSKRYFPPTAYVAGDSIKADTNAFTNVNNLRADALYTTTANSNYARLNLRDLSGFCAVDKAVYGSNFTVTLVPQTSWARAIVRGTDSNAAFIRIEDVQLFMPFARPATELMGSLSKAILSGKTIPISFQSWNIHTKTLAANDGEALFQHNITTSVKRPSAVILWIQNALRLSGFGYHPLYGDAGEALDAGAEQVCGAINQHAITYNSKQFPSSKYTGSLLGYQQEYDEFLRFSGKERSDMVGSYIDIDTWKEAYPVVVYNLDYLRDEFDTVRSGSSSLEWEARLNNRDADFIAHFVVIANEYKKIVNQGMAVSVSSPDFKD